MPFLASLLEIILPFSNAIIVGTASIENLSHKGLLSSSILDSKNFCWLFVSEFAEASKWV
jgi:hypothetical protein